MSNEKFGAAIIGYGGMGSWHARQLKTMEELTLCGVYDILTERNEAAERAGIHAYASREELLNDPAVQVVTVAIPNDLHHDVCIDCMKHGKNVICEKPVCLNHQELQDMIDASREYGVIFTVHQNRRWDEDYLTMKKLYDEYSTLNPGCMVPGGFPETGATRRSTAAAWCWTGAYICWTRL